MFDPETQFEIGELELALQLIPDEEIPQNKEKETSIQKIRNYLTGNSNIWYTYKYDEKTNEIKYSLPRTFKGDLKSVKDYLSNLLNKN
jgi:hypothetical protein